MSSSDSGDEGAQQEVWDDWGGDGEGNIEPVQSLFCDRVFPTAEEALGFDAKEYGFDLRQYRQRVGVANSCKLCSGLGVMEPDVCICLAGAARRPGYHQGHQLYAAGGGRWQSPC